jgi:hypothetical protein
LLTERVEGEWVQPWRDDGRGMVAVPVKVDARVLVAPLVLGVTVKSQPFGNEIDDGWADGAWYRRSDDTIQIPDAARYHPETAGITAAEFYEHNLLHETCHAAWHASRLNRAWRLTFVDGRMGRASHEVVTEMAACLIERKLGMKRPAVWRGATRYIQTWFGRAEVNDTEEQELRDDAVRVADYVIDKLGDTTKQDLAFYSEPQKREVFRNSTRDIFERRIRRALREAEVEVDDGINPSVRGRNTTTIQAAHGARNGLQGAPRASRVGRYGAGFYLGDAAMAERYSKFNPRIAARPEEVELMKQPQYAGTVTDFDLSKCKLLVVQSFNEWDALFKTFAKQYGGWGDEEALRDVQLALECAGYDGMDMRLAEDIIVVFPDATHKLQRFASEPPK